MPAAPKEGRMTAAEIPQKVLRSGYPTSSNQSSHRGQMR